MKRLHYIRKHRKTMVLAVVCSFTIFLADATIATPLANAKVLTAWLQEPQLSFGQTTIETASLNNAYGAEQYPLYWTNTRGLTSRGKAALEQLARAGDHGLDPERYHVGILHTIAALRAANDDEALQHRMSLELLISDSILRYASDLQGGSVAHQWKTGSDRLSNVEQQATLLEVAHARDVAAAMESLAPADTHYKALTASLKQYRSLALKGGWPAYAKGKALKPGQNDPRVASLRSILVAQGDMPASSATASLHYDDALVEGVKRFQERHGIEPEGVIGESTQQALNTTPQEAITQITLTLERMRWMRYSLGSRYVLVNIPAYRLQAVSGNKRMAMDVIVGKPNSKTPMFSKEITQVVLNPTWTVPPKIAAREMLPKIQNNPDYLTRAGFTVIDRTGAAVPADSVDWDEVSHQNFGYTFRQSAGDGNALGKVKFTIPDSDNIYLHDTAQPQLFSREMRSLSHGCVRLSDPKAMAEFVLVDAGWSTEKIDTAYDSMASRTIPIEPLPVHLVYWTAWVDDAGKTHFSRDVYHMNPALMIAMGGSKTSANGEKLAMQ